MIRKFGFHAVFALTAALSAPAFAQTKLVIGSVPTIGDGPIICAMERGYFKEAGLDVSIEPFRSGADMVPLIARGDIQLMGGGMSAALFNAIGDGMPIRYFANRARTPAYHSLVLRKEVAARVKSVKDLKGLTLAYTGAGSQTEYETSKILESAGLTLDDIDLKSLGMPETVLAIVNGAIDGAVLVPPLDENAVRAGGVRFIDPDSVANMPFEISGMFHNFDWAAKNRDTLEKFSLAYIRGARCYLEAVRHGPNRDEVIDQLIKHTPVKDRSIYENTRWAEVDPNGAILPASIMDMQNFFAKRGEVKQVVPIDRIVDLDPVKKALEKLGAAGK